MLPALQPADQVSVRRNNLSLVLRLLHDGTARSRAAVASETGLNKATVSSLVAELIERGLVREVGTSGSGRLGRPATLLELDGRKVPTLGVELNVDVVSVLATDLASRPMFQRSRAIDTVSAPPSRVLRSVAALAAQALRAVHDVGATLAGITVAVPGLVDVEEGRVTLAPNLHWRDIDVGRRLAEALEVRAPVAVDNDANLCALAEYRVGQFAGTPNLLTITGQTGVGGGIVVGGRLLRGAFGFAGEVGHIRVVDDGPRCGCGREGCWEALIGLAALLQAALPDDWASMAGERALDPEAKVARVAARAAAGDEVALAALEREGLLLGRGLATLVNLFNPEVVVLGGFFGDLAPWILPVAEQVLRDEAMAPDGGGVRLAVSTLGFSAAALGGAIHAAERVFDDPALVAPAISA